MTSIVYSYKPDDGNGVPELALSYVEQAAAKKDQDVEEAAPASPNIGNDLIHLSGPIMTRISLRSLVMKKWHPSYWMQYGPHKLIIFRSKDHMDDWRYNPYNGKKQGDFLVKLEIDFLADMGCGADGKDIKQDHHHAGGKEQGVLGHRILPVKKKCYGKNKDELYQFKLERWTNLGCSVLAAFASPEEDLTLLLHEAIGAMLKSCPRNGLRNKSCS